MPRVLPLLAVVSLAFAPAPPPREQNKDDLTLLQGEWELVRMIDQRGRVADLDADERAVLSFSGRRCSFRDGPANTTEWVITLDSSCTPKRIYLRYPEELLKEAPHLADLGGGWWIYRLETQALTIRFSGDKDGLPADFTSPPSGDTADVDICVFKRKGRSGSR
jgi:uncharacterized protein (TIGR03067 family)